MGESFPAVWSLRARSWEIKKSRYTNEQSKRPAHPRASRPYASNPLPDLETDRILDVEATPARFSAEVAATRTLVARVKAKLGIAPTSLAVDKG